MHWKPTWTLVGAAAALFAFIVLFERHGPEPNRPPPPLFSFRAAEVTNVQVRLTNQLLLAAARPGPDTPWNLTAPIQYPAHPFRIDALLLALERELPQTEISIQDLKASKRTVAEFGLDIPRATLTLQHNGLRTEVMFGARTPVGDGVYAQVLNQTPIYILKADLAERLPHSHNDWRSPILLPTGDFRGTAVEVRASGSGFAFGIDPTNRTWILTKPTVARADPAKIETIFRKIASIQVQQFVTDSPRVDLDTYGLQPPELELAFLADTNEVFAVQFGKSPAAEPNLVYARRSTHTNIVLVPRSALETLQISHSDLRDLHLINWPTDTVDSVEVVGTENFAVRRQTNGTWTVSGNPPLLADIEAVREWMEVLSRLEGSVEKDVVTDFANPYGLSPPARRYLIKTTATNALGALSNRVVAEIQLGNRLGEKLFARRPDEQTVYALSLKDVSRLPRAAWQLRDRRVWSFTSNQVHSVLVQHEGRSQTWLRSASGAWGTGVTGGTVMDNFMTRLGELRATVWVAEGDTHRAEFGFNDSSDKVTIELKSVERAQTLVLEFGNASPNTLPYALATVDGQSWIFEFPPALQFELINLLFKPLFQLRR